MGSSRSGHSTGRKAKSRRDHQPSEWKRAFLAIRDELIAIKARATVVQQALTAEQGDTNAAAVLLDGVLSATGHHRSAQSAHKGGALMNARAMRDLLAEFDRFERGAVGRLFRGLPTCYLQ